MAFFDVLISDFRDFRFQSSFRLYFDELGVQVKDWDGLFREMNEGDNHAYVRFSAENQVVGFLMFTPITFTSWFLEEKAGFIREFWITKPFRGRGHGSELLKLTEDWFLSHGLPRAVLTSDTAPGFYLKNGYRPGIGYTAKNRDPVFVKDLS